MICTKYHLCTKTLEYSIKIIAHGVIKGYRMEYKIKCECLIIKRDGSRVLEISQVELYNSWLVIVLLKQLKSRDATAPPAPLVLTPL